MIKFIDFCEVWFLPESVARVPAIVGDHCCHMPRHCFKETLDVFLEYSRPSSLHTLPKLFWCGSWGCNLGQSLSNLGPHIFYRLKIRRVSRPGKQFNLVFDEEPLENARHVWSHIILLKYGCGQALKSKARVISNTAPYHNTRCRTSVVVRNAAVQHPLSTVSPDSSPTIVVLQTDAGLVSKDNFIPFCRPHPSFILPLAAETSVVLRQG
ncbi:uncharacterized protein TNCV_1719031 [Trichonephila clavipes]|nr:uncharacterized protein TNCV_1719031 [Trichonephila clavipes]